MPNISLFGNVHEINCKDVFPVDSYLIEVRDGRYEDFVHPIRTAKDDETKKKLKEKLNRVTFSGIFTKRKTEGLVEHSGIIAIDLDDVDNPEVVKELLIKDKYVYSVFISSGGKGLTVLFKIEPTKHRDSYLGIAHYLLNTYNLVCDPQSISVCKPFGVTYDPHIYIADVEVPIFKKYIRETKVEQMNNFAFANDDFEELLKEISARRINLADDYDRWVKIGFAFAHKFGDAGRRYFHAISSISEKYNSGRADKQFTYCLRSKNLNLATISTFYYYCKEAGLKIFSEKTQKIRKITINSKSAGLSKEQIISNLAKDGINEVDEMVSEIFDSFVFEGDGDSILDQLELWLSYNYKFKRNVLTRYIETEEGRQLEQRDLNTIYISAKKILNGLPYDLFERLIMSDYVKSYNPIKDFLAKFDSEFKEQTDSPLIDRLASSIINDTPEYTKYFLKKWLVSSISAVFGEHSPLLLVLSGEIQGTGKTEFFRRLIPQELKRYYAESKLDAGRDDEILMTQRWFIMDDEMSGKSKKEEQRLKELTSKQWFDLREPYGRINVSLLRLAVLCGTTNSSNIIRDTMNRRIIPIHVQDVDHKIYNSVDKGKLFKEAYFLYKSGFKWEVLKEDIVYLKTQEHEFEAVSVEGELVLKFFSTNNPDAYLTTSEIKVEIEMKTNQRLSINEIGKQLTKYNFQKKTVREGHLTPKKWAVRRLSFGDNSKPQQENPF